MKQTELRVHVSTHKMRYRKESATYVWSHSSHAAILIYNILESSIPPSHGPENRTWKFRCCSFSSFFATLQDAILNPHPYFQHLAISLWRDNAALWIHRQPVRLASVDGFIWIFVFVHFRYLVCVHYDHCMSWHAVDIPYFLEKTPRLLFISSRELVRRLIEGG